MAATFRALAEVVREPGPIAIPVPINLRKRDWSPVVGNYIALQYFVVDPAATADVPALAKQLRAMHVAKIRNGEEAAMIALFWASRLVGFRKTLRGRIGPTGRERNTAYFSNCGEPRLRSFLGRRIRELRVCPSFPASPGVGVYFTLVDGRLLVTTVFIRGNVEEADVDTFVETLRKAL